MSTLSVPPHVPPELVRDFDYLRPPTDPDLYVDFSRLHDGPDIFYSPHHGGHWVVTREEDIAHIFENFAEFSSRKDNIPSNQPEPTPLSEYDGEMHADFRALVAPYFSPKHIGNLQERARVTTISLISEFLDRGECEYISEFADKMPIVLIMGLLGFPDEDRLYLLKIADDLVHAADQAMLEAAFARSTDYLAKQFAERRVRPRDDIMTALLNGRVEKSKYEGGRALTEKELIGTGTLLISAGLDTVSGMLGFITLFLAKNPEHRRQLVEDPGLINDALEELMRRHHLTNLARVVIRDMTYKGVAFKADDVILLPGTVAGLDERRYPDPWTVNFKRGDKRTIVFGKGPHQCIGALLARTELRVFLREWLVRIPDFSLKPGATPIAMPGRANVVRYLPLEWDVSRG